MCWLVGRPKNSIWESSVQYTEELLNSPSEGYADGHYISPGVCAVEVLQCLLQVITVAGAVGSGGLQGRHSNPIGNTPQAGRNAMGDKDKKYNTVQSIRKVQIAYTLI